MTDTLIEPQVSDKVLDKYTKFTDNFPKDDTLNKFIDLLKNLSTIDLTIIDKFITFCRQNEVDRLYPMLETLSKQSRESSCNFIIAWLTIIVGMVTVWLYQDFESGSLIVMIPFIVFLILLAYIFYEILTNEGSFFVGIFLQIISLGYLKF